jgi:hypothetical protein
VTDRDSESDGRPLGPDSEPQLGPWHGIRVKTFESEVPTEHHAMIVGLDPSLQLQIQFEKQYLQLENFAQG